MIDIDNKYQTRDGRPVRLISNNGAKNKPILGVISEGDPGESNCSWDLNGAFCSTKIRHVLDLEPAPPPTKKVKVAVWLDKHENICMERKEMAPTPSNATIVELEVPR
jgi:hypothetical protein